MRSVEIHPDRKISFKNPEKIILDERDQNLWINNVFGINKEGRLPARFLSGFVSTFGLAEMIQEKTDGRANPEVRIFIPSNIGVYVNDVDLESAENQIKQGTGLLETLVTKHYPTVKAFFEYDKPITDEVLQTLENITNLYTKNASDEQLLNGIQESGRRRGGHIGAERALLYASHHPFGWSDLHHLAIFEQKPPFTVINTLPPSERRFTQVRSSIRESVMESDFANLLCAGKRFDLIMMMSNQPHYLLISDKLGNPLEPTIDDLFSTTCGEILDFMEDGWRNEQTPWTKESLRRAKKDFERLLTKLGRNQINDFNKIGFKELLNR